MHVRFYMLMNNSLFADMVLFMKKKKVKSRGAPVRKIFTVYAKYIPWSCFCKGKM